MPVPTELKAAFIRALAGAGLKEIEATSFVSPKWVPQLSDAQELWPQIEDVEARLSALVPNAKGLERAMHVGVRRIALFTAASDEFTKRNINMSVEESLAAFEQVVRAFRESAGPNSWVRGYLSTAFECPYAGRIRPPRVAEIAGALIAIGCDEVSLGDTIGVAVPVEVEALTSALGDSGLDFAKVAWHFHDTRGTALSNVARAWDLGFRAFDASAAGLGGCPYAPGAAGNLATEDLVYYLERSGIPSGVDLMALAEASLPVLRHLGRPPQAKSQVAALASSAPR